MSTILQLWNNADKHFNFLKIRLFPTKLDV
jgi:hypothetical protein